MPASRSLAACSSAAVGCAGSCGMAEAGMPSVRASAAIWGIGQGMGTVVKERSQQGWERAQPAGL